VRKCSVALTFLLAVSACSSGTEIAELAPTTTAAVPSTTEITTTVVSTTTTTTRAPTTTATPTTTTTTPESTSSGKIAFQSDRDGDNEIFVMNADGTGVTQLTDNDDWDRVPVWSPNGKQIAFVSDRYGDNEIFVMNADGSNVVSLGQQGYATSWGG